MMSNNLSSTKHIKESVLQIEPKITVYGCKKCCIQDPAQPQPLEMWGSSTNSNKSKHLKIQIKGFLGCQFYDHCLQQKVSI